MRAFLGDFKKFILRGNVLDLAVAVVVGAAFNSVVQSFANDVVMGFVGAIFGKPNFNEVVIKIASGEVFIGKFITSVVNFVIVGFAVFLAVKAFEAMQKIRRRGEADVEPESDLTVDQELLSEIRDLLRERAEEA
ncbi:MAG TPA: large conductance mechanosensitive channel protein MscL [Acidimicrobiia bacterium]|nr:large conductance mechanosensitive channel protein MscL [Acidimicrobiia bacterium]